MALSQIAPPERLIVEALDLREHLRAMLLLEVPVACQPKENNEPEMFEPGLDRLHVSQRGFPAAAAGLLLIFRSCSPRNVWLAQIKQPEQALCIAPQVPAGTRTAMLLLRAYGALSMQSIQIDVRDPAGTVQRGHRPMVAGQPASSAVDSDCVFWNPNTPP